MGQSMLAWGKSLNHRESDTFDGVESQTIAENVVYGTWIPRAKSWISFIKSFGSSVRKMEDSFILWSDARDAK